MFNVQLNTHILKHPIIQGGMGVGVSMSKLATAAINHGCMGVISAAQPGYKEDDFYTNNFQANIRALKQEIDITRHNTQHQGVLAVNVMVASKRYNDYIKEISTMDIDAIISGAGLPLNLPELVQNKELLLGVIVSSGKAAQLICKVWDTRYNRIPDFIVIEGDKAGGHLGFKIEELRANSTRTLDEILEDVLQVTLPYKEKYNKAIPLFVAGGIVSGYEIAHYIKKGASGVQMGTAFLATKECDAPLNFKQAVIDATIDDIGFTKSPSKLHGRALKTPFMMMVNQRHENIQVKRCVACLSMCNPSDTPYCISQALIDSINGNLDEGIVFVGESAARINAIVSVSDLVERLMKECISVYET